MLNDISSTVSSVKASTISKLYDFSASLDQAQMDELFPDTLPLMLGLGPVAAALGKKFANAVQSVGAVIVAVMGLALLTQGGVLSGVLPTALVSAGSAKDTAVNIGSVQIVESVLTPGRYPEITVQAGVPVRWNIRAEKSSINGCNYMIVCKNLGNH